MRVCEMIPGLIFFFLQRFNMSQLISTVYHWLGSLSSVFHNIYLGSSFRSYRNVFRLMSILFFAAIWVVSTTMCLILRNKLQIQRNKPCLISVLGLNRFKVEVFTNWRYHVHTLYLFVFVPWRYCFCRALMTRDDVLLFFDSLFSYKHRT